MAKSVYFNAYRIFLKSRYLCRFWFVDNLRVFISCHSYVKNGVEIKTDNPNVLYPFFQESALFVQLKRHLSFGIQTTCFFNDDRNSCCSLNT